METLRSTSSKGGSLLSVAIMLYAMTAVAQNTTDNCRPAPVIPLTSSEPPAKVVIDPPLAGPLASRGVVIIQYCAQNLHIAPVFGPNAVAVSPRVGHVHVSVDDAPWVWADASGSPIILQHLPPGPHKVVIELNDANHHPLDKGSVTFTVPEKTAAEEHSAPASGHADGAAAPIFGVTIPPGYRDWRLISVAHEEGNLNDLRTILGNDVAIKAYREGELSFPDGTIIARLAWNYVPSEDNNKAFGRSQSFVADSATNIQFMVKDSKKYATTGGWGFAQFTNGEPDAEAVHKTCFPCHQAFAKGHDSVFTHYAP